MTDMIAPQLDWDRSRRISNAIGAGMRHCWWNARRALRTRPELEHGRYVEGYVVTLDHLLPVEHGWVEHDGVIIDPTLYHTPCVYFPGLRFTKAEIAAVRGYKPIAWQYGWAGEESPQYHAAYARALAFVGEHLQLRRVDND